MEERSLVQTNPPTSTDIEQPFAFSKLTRIQNAILNTVLASDCFMTIKDIAAELEISPNVVSKAMRDEKYMRAYQQVCIAHSNMKFGAVLESTTNLAVAGSAKHQEMYYKIHRVLHDKTHDAPLPRDEDDDITELRKRQKEIEAKLRTQHGIVNAEFEEQNE